MTLNDSVRGSVGGDPHESAATAWGRGRLLGQELAERVDVECRLPSANISAAMI